MSTTTTAKKPPAKKRSLRAEAKRASKRSTPGKRAAAEQATYVSDDATIETSANPSSTAQRAPKEAKPARMSGLDAAADLLAHAAQPLSCGEIVERLISGGLWTTKGKTPAATIYSAIIREIAMKGTASRFRKVDRGRFGAA